jgi:glucosamine-6-phosphate deaminase
MKLNVHRSADEANARAAELLAEWVIAPDFKTLMVAAGNTPLDLYGRIAAKRLSLEKLKIFMLDEYVGVPLEEPRNCANLLRRSVADAWGIAADRYFTISSIEREALEAIQKHERLIHAVGGLDAVILGLGKNGHLGFNEPGSSADSIGRVVQLEKISVDANREWFKGRYAPAKGVTVGLRTILEARRVIILAFGPHKEKAVQAMIKGEPGPNCPASFLQMHPQVEVFLDESAAQSVRKRIPR